MTFKVFAPQTKELKPRIVVFGVGGAGGNAVNNMIEAGLEGVEFVVANTDAQQLAFSKTDRRIQLGVQVTQGLGAGAHPEVGMSRRRGVAARRSASTSTAPTWCSSPPAWAAAPAPAPAPIIAKCARERGILTVGVVTKPFHFEGRHRMRLADAGIAELQRYVDTLIVIPNQNLFRVANERTTFAEAFGMADQVLHSGVRSITDLMVLPGLINLDFADVRTVMTEMGKAMMGTGEATGEDRALMAAENAIQNPLLDEVSLKGAKAVLVNVTGGLDMTLLEVDEAANAISGQVDPEANIIFGAAFDPSLDGMIRVSVVATGMDGASIAAIEPKPSRRRRRPATAADRTRPRADAPPTGAGRRPSPCAPVSDARADRAPSPSRSRAEPAERRSSPTLGLDRRPPRRSADAAVVAAARRRVVDPAAAEAEDEPLFAEPAYDDDRQQKGGWLSLFGGRPRYDRHARRRAHRRRAAPARGRGAHLAAAGAARGSREPTDAEDLEIPSFLRRLAN